jgi:hypothetical protein
VAGVSVLQSRVTVSSPGAKSTPNFSPHTLAQSDLRSNSVIEVSFPQGEVKERWEAAKEGK